MPRFGFAPSAPRAAAAFRAEKSQNGTDRGHPVTVSRRSWHSRRMGQAPAVASGPPKGPHFASPRGLYPTGGARADTSHATTSAAALLPPLPGASESPPTFAVHADTGTQPRPAFQPPPL